MQTDQKWIVVRIDGRIAGVSTDYRVLAKITKSLATASEVQKKSDSKSTNTSVEPIIYKEVSATAVTIDDVLKLKAEVQWDDLLLLGTDFQKKVWRKLWDLTHEQANPDTKTTHQTRAGTWAENEEEIGSRAGARAGNEKGIGAEIGAEIGAGNDKENGAETGAETGAENEIGRRTETGAGNELGSRTKTGAENEAEIGSRADKMESGRKALKRGLKLYSYSDFAELCDNRAGVRAVAHAIGLNPISVLIPCHLVVPKESIDRIREIQRKAEATIFKGEDLCLSSILADTTIDFGEYSLGKSLKRDLISLDLA